jgi:23S rRNA (guanosine2251-2'-O)-methyltransferase
MSRLAYGRRPVEEVLRHSREQVDAVFLDESKREALADVAALARDAGLAATWVSRQEMARLCETPKNQGVAARLRDFQYASVKDFLQRRKTGPRVVVALDGVTDPQNFGACLRAAGAFGAHLVITTKHRGCPVTAAVAKVSAGATEAVPIAREANLVQALQRLKDDGFWVYGLDHEAAKTLGSCDLSGDVALVLGSEGEGLHRLVRETCDEIARIPAGGPIQSLNVAQACSVALYEVTRQRGPTAPSPA